MSMLPIVSFFNLKRFGRFAFLGILITLLSIVFIHSPVSAQSTIKIESDENVLLGSSVDVSVVIDSLDPNHEINGFDILINYENFGIYLAGVSQGQLIEACQWEYFTYRSSTFDDSLTSFDLVRVVGVADLNNATTPICDITQPGELFVMTFNTSSAPVVRCVTNNINFIWNDCGDNMFSMAGSEQSFISRRVFGNDTELTDYDGSFPSFGGTPDFCTTMGQDTSQFNRGMNFINGAVTFQCEDTTGSNYPTVGIGFTSHAVIGGAQPATVYYEASPDYPLELGGFDLMLDYDPNVLTVDTVSLGYHLEQYGWEYFTYRDEPNYDCSAGNCQGGVLRIVSIAELGNPPTSPSRFIDTSVSLANISFRITNDSSYQRHQSKVNWLWSDCGDNMFSTVAGDSLFISNKVYDVFGNDITSENTFPSFGGALSECLTEYQNIVRGINYQSGQTAEFDLPWNFRGDLNLNMLSYEIADYILFTNYFIDGIGVFIIDSTEQIGATDVNADGLVLGLDDLVYLYRVIIGDALPMPTPGIDTNNDIVPLSVAAPYDTVTIIHDEINQTVSLDYADSVSALYFRFDGPVSHYAIADQIADRIIFDSMATSILISPNFMNNPTGIQTIDPGFLFGYNGQANLVEVKAAYNGLSELQTIIVTEDTTITPDSALASVHLWTTSHAAIGSSQPVWVYLRNSSPTPLVLAGFEFQIEFDTTKLILDTVRIGSTLASMGWELGGYRFEPVPECIDTICNKTLLTGAIFADFFGIYGPPQFIDTSVMLLDIMFHITNDSSMERQTAELNWFWSHCAVNSFSSQIGDSMIIVNNAFDGYGNLRTTANSSPWYVDVPDSCGNDNYLLQPYPLVDFYSGVTAEFDLPWNDRGDINLNLIPNEIADLVLFYNYFVYGPQVFIKNIEAQIEASDCNANGIPLELADLVYLFRIIIGDALPYPTPAVDTIPVEFNNIISLAPTALYDTVTIIHDNINNTISLDYTDSISALYFVFDSPVSQNMVADQISNKIGFDSLTTKVLIAPNLGDTLPGVPTIDSGFLFSYNGEANLIEVEAAYNGLSELQTLVVAADSTVGCCQMRGNIDGDDNPVSNITDLLYLVDYMFAFGPPPPCMEEANVDGDGEPRVDIVDLMYLVNYMFIAGPPPIPCH